MASHADQAASGNDRLLGTLERLLEIEAVGLSEALDQASAMVAKALGADKVDVFLYELSTDSLVAMGTSATPLGRQQHAIGMNRLAITNDGPAVKVFQTGSSYVTGHLEQDPDGLPGAIDGLGVRSEMDAPMDVDGQRRGIVQVSSLATDAYSERDLRFLEAVSRWIGMVTHRAELVQEMTRRAEEHGRRAAVDELVSLLTPRQREVAALIATGMTNEQIASRLVLTTGTVANHVQHILERLGANRRTQIASWITEYEHSKPGLDGTTPK